MATPEGIESSQDKDEEILDFKQGETVRVLRTSGETDDDWEVFGYDEYSGTVTVHKEDPKDGQLTKVVKAKDLRSWNR